MTRHVLLMNLAASTALWNFAVAHQFVFGLIASWMFSAYASQLTAPQPLGNRFYAWWYAVVHFAAANLDRFRGR
jgi:hypothetical protein